MVKAPSAPDELKTMKRSGKKVLRDLIYGVIRSMFYRAIELLSQARQAAVEISTCVLFKALASVPVGSHCESKLSVGGFIAPLFSRL